MLKLENLSVRYGDFIAVSSVSIHIPEGKIVALIGSNGAGKSSLLNAAAGLVPCDSGRALFANEDITDMPACRIAEKGLSLIPQGGHCFDRMSVQDNLLTGSYRKEARPFRKDTLQKVYDLFPELYLKRKESAGKLSGGQRQMTAIGRALMAGPKCLIFDEISLGLAPIVIEKIYDCIIRLNREEHLTIVLVEQDIERALKISDTCYIMLKGRVVLSGTGSDLSRDTIRSAYFGL